MIKRKDKTRTKDIGTIGCERRYIIGASEYKPYIDFYCPFCNLEIKSIKWSLQGTGKACECGALFKIDSETVIAFKKEVNEQRPEVR